MTGQFGSETVIAEHGSTKIVKPATDTRFRLRSKVTIQTPDRWKLLDKNVTLLTAAPLSPACSCSPHPAFAISTTNRPTRLRHVPARHVWLMYSDPP